MQIDLTHLQYRVVRMDFPDGLVSVCAWCLKTIVSTDAFFQPDVSWGATGPFCTKACMISELEEM